MTANVMYQDNKSTILLEKNGKFSRGQRTKDINLRYFFMTDRIKMGEMSIEYFPTGDMLGYFFTKPTHGEILENSDGIL